MPESSESTSPQSPLKYFLSGIGVGVLAAVFYQRVLAQNTQELTVKIYQDIDGKQVLSQYFYDSDSKVLHFKEVLSDVHVTIVKNRMVIFDDAMFSGQSIILTRQNIIS
tara:strand:+ start:1753 stop:2079 length:327 start_codon:yes stop_codon:yes gene_type:complete